MTTSSIILGILFILCLTSSVVPRSVGLIKYRGVIGSPF